MPEAAPSRVPPALTALDERVECATGFSVDELWEYEPHLADPQIARVAAAHRELATATRAVDFQRVLLNRLSSGEFAVDAAVLERIAQAVEQMEEAADRRSTLTFDLLHALRPLEKAARSRARDQGDGLDPFDHAALAALAPGDAVLHEHLLTNNHEVVCASGTRLTEGELRRLEEQGLARRDATQPLHEGQPVTLTDHGRCVLEHAQETARAVRPAPTVPSVAARSALAPPTTAAKEAHGRHR